ncbi:MAG: hypothetical protein RLZZ517_13 [Candidatus Parcubacteria bacterium]|jgi:hypothetical protein
MIVYFSRKSKEVCLVWSSVALAVLVLVYLLYVAEMISIHKQSTIQIIRNTSNFESRVGVEESNPQVSSLQDDFVFVASKKGVYYYPINCNKAQALSVKNMLYFKDKMTAEGAGYKPYLGCF